MDVDTIRVQGDDYLNERRDEFTRGLKRQYQFMGWLWLAAGAAGGAYMVWGDRWQLIVFMGLLTVGIVRIIDIAKSEQMFLLGSLENRARTLEARTERISAIQDRWDKQGRGM